LWGAFQTATQEWFNQKVEEVLGLGTTVWKVLNQGGIKTAEVGKMAWDGIKSAIPPALIQILIEKVISMIVPAAGAVLAIIQGLQAAWGTVSRVIQAFDRFMGFLKAVKTGQSGPQFGSALAAAGVVLIDFVSNWLLKRVRGAASKVAGKIKEIAKKIGRKLKAATKKLGRKFGKVKDKFFGKKGGKKDENNKPGGKSNRETKEGKEKNDLAEKQRRVDKAVEVATAAVDRFAGKRVGKIILKPILAGIKLSYKLRSLELIPDGKSWTVYGTINPFAKRKTNALVLSEQDAQDIEERINSGDGSVTREEWEALNRRTRITRRMQRLEAEGHGPARHGSRLTEQQLIDRATLGHDPVTGTTDDAYNRFPNGTPKPHKYGRNATKVNTDEAYVQAEARIKNSQQFKDETAAADAAGKSRTEAIEMSLEDIYGSNYTNKVYGKTRQGSANNPTGTTDTDFTNGKMRAYYEKDASGNWRLITMYPNPQ
jgi:hypothetical protein